MALPPFSAFNWTSPSTACGPDNAYGLIPTGLAAAPCALPCPLPVLTAEQYRNTYLVSVTLGWSSFLLCAVAVATLLASPVSRAWPRRVVVYPMIAAVGLSVVFVGNSLLGSVDRVLCEPDGYTPSARGWCRAQGVAVIVFANALVFWLVVLSFHLFWLASGLRLPACLRAVPEPRAWRLVECLYHLVGWGPALVAGVCAAALQLTGASFGQPFCFFTWSAPFAVGWYYFFGPYCLAALLATVLLLAALFNLRGLRAAAASHTHQLRILLFALLFWLFGAAVIACWAVLMLVAADTQRGFADYLACINAGQSGCQPPAWRPALIYLNTVAVAWPGSWLFVLFATTRRNVRAWQRLLLCRCCPAPASPAERWPLRADRSPTAHSINWSEKNSQHGNLSDIGYFEFMPTYSSSDE